MGKLVRQLSNEEYERTCLFELKEHEKIIDGPLRPNNVGREMEVVHNDSGLAFRGLCVEETTGIISIEVFKGSILHCAKPCNMKVIK